jgi:methionyl-tRNA formyltransferase
LRGPSPMRSAILNDEKETGVSVMLMDEQMDHGPLIAQRKVAIEPWPPHGKTLEDRLAHEGGKLLAQILPLWLQGTIQPQEQNHDLATYTKKFTKEDGALDLGADPYQNLLTIRAFESWPGTYAFFERAGKRIRVQILDAHIEGKKLVIDIVKPEGKKEMSYADFLRSGAKPV